MPRGAKGEERVYRHVAWSVPLAISDVSEAGRHLDLVADAQARAAVATLAGLAALPRLEASFDVTRRGRGGLHVVGRVSATVGQTCVVTLEPLENEVDEDIDVAFVPAAASSLRNSIGEVEVPLEDAPGAAGRRRDRPRRDCDRIPDPWASTRIRASRMRSSRLPPAGDEAGASVRRAGGAQERAGRQAAVSIRPPVASPTDTVWFRHAP